MSGSPGKPVVRSATRAEVDRLGRRGSYRLGGFGPPGTGHPAPPRPYRPVFLRPQHAGTAAGWMLAGLAATVVIAAAAVAGVWFAPFLAGLATGIAMSWGGWRLRASGPAVTIMAAGGWALAFWVSALRGLPVGPTARTIAVVSGLPPVAVLVVTAMLAVAVVQGLAGLWLGRALAPRPGRD